MNDRWSSYGNSYLRHLELLPKSKNKLTISTLSLQELQLVLEQILMFDQRMKFTREKLECHTQISLSVVDSEETMS